MGGLLDSSRLNYIFSEIEILCESPFSIIWINARGIKIISKSLFLRVNLWQLEGQKHAYSRGFMWGLFHFLSIILFFSESEITCKPHFLFFQIKTMGIIIILKCLVFACKPMADETFFGQKHVYSLGFMRGLLNSLSLNYTFSEFEISVQSRFS